MVISDIRVVATSAIVSIVDVTVSVIVAIITGSTVMLAQALQGLSDLVTAGLLYIGVKRSGKIPDARFQFGYGREIFFWVLVAGVVMFIGTGGMSVYFGYQKFLDPDPIEHVFVAIIVLLIGFVTNFYAFNMSLQRMRQFSKKRRVPWWQYFIRSSIVETKATLTVDFLGVVSALLGFLSLAVYAITGNAKFDGIGGIVIGITMMISALFLIWNVRDLLVGRGASEKTEKQIIRVAKSVDKVVDVLDLRTMYIGSANLLVIIEVHIEDGQTTDEIELIIDNIKEKIARLVPNAKLIQVEVETPESD